MNKTPLLLSLLLLLGALLVVGWGWMARESSQRLSDSLAPREAEDHAAPDETGSPLKAGPAEARLTDVNPGRGSTTPLPPRAFVAHGVMGRVFDTEGNPLPKASVSCSLNHGGARMHLGWARSESDGSYSIEVDFAERISRQLRRTDQMIEHLSRYERADQREARDPRYSIEPNHRRAILESFCKPLVLEVTAHASEDRQTTRRLLLGADPPDLLRLDLKLESLFSFSGRVVGGDRVWGVGQSPSDVILLDGDWRVVGVTKTDAQGGFEFATPDPGLYIVHARQEGAGAGMTSGFHLGPKLGSPRLEVVLAGESTLSGRVVFPDGSPVTGVRLVGIQDGLFVLDPRRPEWPELSALVQAETVGGLALSHATTDRTGRFSMRAMQEGNYAIRFESLGELHQPEGVFSTGVDHDVAFTARLLTVTVIAPTSIAMRAQVHCEEAILGDSSGNRPRRRATRPTRRGRATFIVEAGTTWRVWCGFRGVRSEERLVRIDESTYELAVALFLEEEDFEDLPFAFELPEPPRPSHLLVELVDEKGAPLPTAVTLWRLEGDGRTRLFDALPRKAGERLPALEPGEYRFTVRATGDSGEMLLPVEGEEALRVSPGEERRVVVRAERGGRLALRLTRKDAEAELSAEHAVQASLILVDGEEAPIPLRFRGESRGKAPSSTLFPGRAAVCEPAIPAGRYHLQLLSPAFEVRRILVEVEVGKTAVAEIVLVDRSAE